ncbi:MAG: GIY-YIG nuclease family protein [Candidatus Levybacteria bacterium]|nr:GIY-YIG nuclease family protein [Candidatus Levybacteria bacterium]
MPSYFIYILECADGTYYTGSTNDVEKRVFNHNNAKTGAKYTKSRRPVKLVYQESLDDKGAALTRENQIKKLTRRQKQRLIQPHLSS